MCLTACASGSSRTSSVVAGIQQFDSAAERYGACPADRGPVDLMDPVHYLNHEQIEWRELVRTPTLRGPSVESDVSTLSGMMTVALDDEAGDHDEFTIAASKIPGLKAGWAVGSRTMAATSHEADPTGPALISALVVLPKDGSPPYFAGQCAFSDQTSWLQRDFGAGYSKAIEDLVAGKGIAKPATASTETSPSDDVVILNPDTAPRDLLAALESVDVQSTIPQQWREESQVICSKIEAGWNDCVAADFAGGWPAGLNAYVDKGGSLEFWVLPASGDARQAIGRVASIDAKAVLAEAAKHYASLGVTLTTTASLSEALKGDVTAVELGPPTGR